MKNKKRSLESAARPAKKQKTTDTTNATKAPATVEEVTMTTVTSSTATTKTTMPLPQPASDSAAVLAPVVTDIMPVSSNVASNTNDQYLASLREELSRSPILVGVNIRVIKSSEAPPETADLENNSIYLQIRLSMFGEKQLFIRNTADNYVLERVSKILNESADTSRLKLVLDNVDTANVVFVQEIPASSVLPTQANEVITPFDTSNLSPEEMEDAIFSAAQDGDLQKIKLLLTANPSLITTLNPEGSSVFHVAVNSEFDPEIIKNDQARYFEVMKYFLELDKTLLTKTDNNGNTVLYYATARGIVEAIKYLLELDKTLLTKTNNNGDTVLHYACEQVEAITYLLKLDKTLLTKTNNNGDTVLHAAAEYGNIEVMTYLLELNNTLLTKTNNDGHTVFQIAAEHEGADTMGFFLERAPQLLTLVHSDHPIVHKFVGYEFMKIAKYQEAIISFKQVIDAGGDNFKVTSALATSYTYMKNFAQAEALFNKILATSHDKNTLLSAKVGLAAVKIGLGCTAEGNKSLVLEGVNILTEARSSGYPDDVSVFTSFAKANLFVNNYQLAGELFQKAINFNPQNMGIYNDIMDHYISVAARLANNQTITKQTLIKKALEFYDEAISSQSTSPAFKEKLKSKVVDLYMEYTKYDHSKIYEMMFKSANYLAETGKDEDALKLIKIDPNNFTKLHSIAYYTLAHNALKCNDYNKALLAFQHAGKHDSTIVDIYPDMINTIDEILLMQAAHPSLNYFIAIKNQSSTLLQELLPMVANLLSEHTKFRTNPDEEDQFLSLDVVNIIIEYYLGIKNYFQVPLTSNFQTIPGFDQLTNILDNEEDTVMATEEIEFMGASATGLVIYGEEGGAL